MAHPLALFAGIERAVLIRRAAMATAATWIIQLLTNIPLVQSEVAPLGSVSFQLARSGRADPRGLGGSRRHRMGGCQRRVGFLVHSVLRENVALLMLLSGVRLQALVTVAFVGAITKLALVGVGLVWAGLGGGLGLLRS